MTKNGGQTKKVPYLNEKTILELSREDLKRLYRLFGNGLFFKWNDDDGEQKRGMFVPARLAAFLRVMYIPLTMIDNDNMFMYDWKNEIYIPNADVFLADLIKKMWGEDYYKKINEETQEHIIRTTHIDRKKFIQPLGYIPVNEGILKIIRDHNGDCTIELLPNSPKYNVVSRFPINYNPSARSLLWENFLKSSYDEVDILFLQEFFGTLYWNRVNAPGVATMLYGPTQTGKGTVIEVACALMGIDASTRIAFQDLRDSHERVRLFKKSLCTHPDIGAKGLKGFERIKSIISGEEQSARRLYENPFKFDCYVKLLFSCNQIPWVYDDTDAWYTRWKIIVVDKKQYINERDGRIEGLNYLLTTPKELSGIFNWALEGLFKYLKHNRYNYLDPWTYTKSRWQLFSDPIGQFFGDTTWVFFHKDSSVLRGALHEHYEFWCNYNGIKTPVSKKKFGREVMKRYVQPGIIQPGWIKSSLAWNGVGIKKIEI